MLGIIVKPWNGFLLSQVLMLLKAYKIMEIGKYESIFEIVGFKIWI